MITLLEKYTENKVENLNFNNGEKYVGNNENSGSFFEFDNQNRVYYNTENQFEGSKILQNMRMFK